MPITKVSVLRLKENMREHRTLQTITGNLKTEEQFNDMYQGKPEITKKCNQMK